MVDTPKQREALSSCYAEITVLEAEIKKCTDLLDKYNIANDTILTFVSEQGAATPHSKWTLYDVGLHVGFIVRWPGVVKPGSTNNAMIETIDFVPTLLEAVGAASGTWIRR